MRTGQRVIAVLRNGGGYAEEIMLDAATVVPIPETMDFVTAAAFPVAYGTSHFALTPTVAICSREKRSWCWARPAESA